MRCSYEINALLCSKRLAKELEEHLARNFAHRTEFEPDVYLRCSAAVRFTDSVARLTSPVL
jgi:hypothetical protein